MRPEPPANLVALLARLRLATAAQVRAVGWRVRRLSGDFPDFESVWVDALGQSGALTPLQVLEINAGRGDALLHGPYVIERALAGAHYALCHVARHSESGRRVRLYTVARPQASAATAARRLTALVEQLAPLRAAGVGLAEDAGTRGEGVWAACAAVDGVTAAEWMVENGRFPPHVVVHIAREMLERLSELERLGVPHGDISAGGLVLRPSGHVVLPMPGLRAIVRPAEGYSFQDLPCEAYDYLAPERVADGSGPTIASDLYACGCVWWHLLTGRPPLAGGNSLMKLKAAHQARILDVRQLAPDVPDELARAIELCLVPQPQLRAASTAPLISLLGPAPRMLGNPLVGCLRRRSGVWRGSEPVSRHRRAKRAPLAVGVALAIVALLVALRPLWRGGDVENLPLAAATFSPEEPAPALVAAPLAEPTPPPIDSEVVPVAATAAAAASEDLILPAGTTLRLADLDLTPGRRVRGVGGARPRVIVGGEGLRVTCEDVTFEGIDFAWDDDRAVTAPSRHKAMFEVVAQAVEFRGCSFSTAAVDPPSVILWLGADGDDLSAQGELRMQDCVVVGFGAVVDCRSARSVGLTLSNTLCVAAGPLLRLHRTGAAEGGVAIRLDHVTLRGDSAVLECRYARIDAAGGPITISAHDSAFDGNPRGGLLLFSGPMRPVKLLKNVVWDGQGSLLAPDVEMALWQRGAKHPESLPEDDMEVAGLVRSRIEFAGEAQDSPAASRVTRWQGPLRSDEPPGADPNLLFLPQHE